MIIIILAFPPIDNDDKKIIDSLIKKLKIIYKHNSIAFIKSNVARYLE